MRYAGPSIPFRVATWNLDHASSGRRPVDDQIKVIHTHNPDIIVLTETCDKVNLSSLGYVCRAARLNKYKKNYSAVWSKWSIAEEIATYDPETATCVRAQGPNGDLLIYGTILTWHGDKGQDGESKRWEEHDREIVRQGDDWVRIQKLHPGVPLIVAGDFNQARDGVGTYHSKDGIRLLDEQMARTGLICLTEENFFANGKLALDPVTGNFRNNIDHICVSTDHFEVLAVGAWDHFSNGRPLSDHNGVFVDMKVC